MPAAVFTILISIAFKLLSAMVTYEMVISFLPHLISVTIPPSHTALICAEQFFFPPRRLHNGFAAAFAGFAAGDHRVAANMGADGVDRDAQCAGNFPWRFSLQAHLVNDFDLLLFNG